MRRIIFLTDDFFPRSGAVSGYIENIIILTQKAFLNADIVLVARNNKLENCSLSKIRFVNIDSDNRIDFIKKMIRAIDKLNIVEEDIIFNFVIKPENQVFIYLKLYRNRGRVISYFGELFDLKYFGVSIVGMLKYLRYIVGFYIRSCYDNAVVVSTYLQKKLRIENIICIPPMCNMNEGLLRNVSEKKWDNVNFIYPGSDKKKDRIESIIEVFGQLSKTRSDVKLHITGVKNEKEMFSNKIEKLVNDGIIITHGWLSNDEYNELLAKMDFCIIIRDKQQSSMANFPSKVPETMQYGIIPIVSSIGDYTELYLNNNNSFIVEGSEVDKFYLKILEILNMEPAELEAIHYESSKIAYDKFDIDNWVKIFHEYICRVFY